MTAQNAGKSLLEYANLLVQVQHAIRDGDDQKAALLRRQSEEIDDLTPVEIEWLYGLSGDLDMLTGDEIFETARLSQPQLVRALQIQNEQSNGEAMLVLLRQMPFIKHEHLAYFRARAYDFLGFAELSVVFFRRAVELAADNDRYACLLIEKLTALQWYEDARELALERIQRPDVSDDLLVFSAGALLSSTRGMNDEAASTLCRMAVEMLAPILETPARASQLSASQFIFAMLTQGMCLLRLHDFHSALEIFDQILSLHPGNPDFLSLRDEARLLNMRASDEDLSELAQFDESTLRRYIPQSNTIAIGSHIASSSFQEELALAA